MAVVRAGEAEERFVLDDEDRVVEHTDVGGEPWTARYDSAGRVVESAGPNHRDLVRFTESVMPTEVSLGDRWVELEHDGGLRLSELRIGDERWRATHDALGHVASVAGPGVDRRYERDPTGRVTAVVKDGIREAFHWTQTGDLVAARLVGGDWTIERDAGGMPVNVGRPDFGAELLWTGERRLAEVRDRRGRRWIFERDRLGRVVNEVDFTGRAYAFRYDGALTRPAQLTLPDGQRISLRYDEAGRLRRAAHAAALLERFEYDAAGRLIEAWRGDVAVRLERGRGGAVIAEQQGEDRVEARIDPLGRRSMVQSSMGARIARSWAPDGSRLLSIDAFGRTAEVALRRGDVRVGPLVLTRAEDRLPSPTGARGTLAHHESERAVHFVDASERRWVYGYGLDGLVDEVRSPDGGALRYRYDAFGRRLSVEGTDHDYRWVWDGGLAIHEVCSHAPPTLYVFDPVDGSPVGKVRPDGSFWLGLHEDYGVLYDEARGVPSVEPWPWRGGLQVDGRTHLWLGPGVAFHRGAAEPLGYGRVSDELLGPTEVGRFDYEPHIAKLAARASDASLRDFVHRLTTPPVLDEPEGLVAPLPDPLVFDDLRPRGRLLEGRS